MNVQLMLDANGKLTNKLKNSIEYLKMFEPAEGYYIAYSGGKDSEVLIILCELAGVKYEIHNNHTTLDPPELVYHIRKRRKQYNNLTIHYPEQSMWQLIENRGVPTRVSRFCCSELKERGGEGRFVVTGVRWAESNSRKNNRNMIEFNKYGGKSKKVIKQQQIFLHSDNDEKRRMIENCTVKGKHIINPIIAWEDWEVWDFLKHHNVDYCELYDNGFNRLGCIGCPLAGSKHMIFELERYPKYKENYLKAFKRMLSHNDGKNIRIKWKSAEEVMKWWLSFN